MKIALVHELLTMRGGAERMLRVVADMFPDAPIYTLLYDEKKLGEWFPRERVRAARFFPYPLPLTPYRYNHHLYLRRFPKAIESWPFDGVYAEHGRSTQGDTEYDLVLSFSSAFAHGIKTRGMTKHLCYVHTPARYLWDQTFDVLERAEQGFLGSFKRRYLERTFHKLRQWDAQTSERPDKLLAASKAVKRRIELYWRRESEVLYPPVDTEAFPLYEGERGDYYVIASTLVPYKRIELAIEVCNRLKRSLKIMGEGPHRATLEKLAGPTIAFVGYKDHRELVPLFQHARAFLFPGEEDFGIAPVEAMACGTPVIAYRGGGALETLIPGETGEFFMEATQDSLLQAMQKYEQKSYSTERCRAQAEKFSKAIFTQRIRGAVESVLSAE